MPDPETDFELWAAMATPIELHHCREDLAERMRLIDDELSMRRLTLHVVRNVRLSGENRITQGLSNLAHVSNT